MVNRPESHKTICSYCGVGCGIKVSVDNKRKISLEGDKDYPVNKGKLCSKGMSLHYTVMDTSDRLLYPQMRGSKNHPLKRVSWDNAIHRAAAVFKTLIANHGPDSVGFYVSGQCLTEEYYLVNKLTKGFLGTNNIDTNSRLCMSSAVAGYKIALGEDSVPLSYDDIELADCFFISGANPAWCHPILFQRVLKHKENHPEVKIIVVDPRATDTCDMADQHLQILPGTDEVLLHAIARALIEQGYTDDEFINNHTDGYQPLHKEVMKTTLKEAAAICQISVNDIIQAARTIGNSKAFISMWAMGLNQSTDGVNKNLALLNLHLITGQIGKPGSGPFSLTGQPNAMGGREVGGMSNLLAAHRDLLNADHRQEVADFWGVRKISGKPGLTATEMFDALKTGKMKAIWIICTNPSVSMPNARIVDEALSQAKFVVVQEISSASDTAQYADLLLPAASWLEKEGTMTNSERRISYLPKVIDAPGEALSDAQIIMRFAQAMGFSGFDFHSMEEVYNEHCRLTKGTRIDISGLGYEALKKQSMQWPVLSSDHPGTPRLFTDKHFYTDNGKAKINISGAAMKPEPLSENRPLILTTGRIRDQWHTMTRTGKVHKLKKHLSQPFLEIHPHDAQRREIRDGDSVNVLGDRGEVRVTAKVTSSIKKGVVFLPMHWGKMLGEDKRRANNITSGAVDPRSKQPGFKYSSVEVVKYIKPKAKILIVGAGTAAFRFIQTYRERNAHDEIHVFSKEKWPFYNRVLLPDYVNDHKKWTDLAKYEGNELDQLGVVLHVSNGIVSIDRKNKTVTDEQGQMHVYDQLILATGSKAFVPPGAPMHIPGIFTMRERNNADDLKQFLNAADQVLVIGGGLLGLEMVASLREMEMQVTIVQLSSRLMERQLDATASTLLRQFVEELGAHVITNDQVIELKQIGENEGIKANFRSGKTKMFNCVIYAVGTRPNAKLAINAGLETSRGIVVNQYLQTSDPDIFAIGEIAEFQQRTNGTTAAAEEQADCCAKYILGDPGSVYYGSTVMNILKFSHLDLCSIGLPEIPINGKNYDEIIFMDRSHLYYKKCIIHEDRLVGAILMGDKNEFADFKQLIETKTELSEKRMKLLRYGNASVPIKGKLVCSCNNVGLGNLRSAIEEGCSTLEAICQSTGAGLGCGSCKSEVQRMLNNHLETVNS